MKILRALIVLCAVVCPFAGTARSQNYPSGGRQVPCSSDDGRRRYCSANTRAGVALEKQTSGAVCQEGYSWGYDEGGIWVDHGCRAYFRVEYERPGENRGGESIVRCSSDDGGRHYCEADTRGDVDLVRQHSDAPCEEGVSWGFDQRGIWVDQGCRAEFVAQPNERPNRGGYGGGPTQSLYCASDDGRRNYCQADTRGGAQMVKQRSGAACQEGDTHGELTSAGFGWTTDAGRTLWRGAAERITTKGAADGSAGGRLERIGRGSWWSNAGRYRRGRIRLATRRIRAG